MVIEMVSHSVGVKIKQKSIIGIPKDPIGLGGRSSIDELSGYRQLNMFGH